MSTRMLVATRQRLEFKTGVMFLALIVGTFVMSTACGRSATHEIAVNAPASGVVRSVLVNEGAVVDKNAAIIEIAVPLENPRAAQPKAASSDQAERENKTNLASVEAEADRTAEESSRIEALVKRGLASQAELDKARAQALDARERLELAKKSDKVKQDQPTASLVTEEIVTVRVPAAGTIRALSVREGQKVAVGESMAKLVFRT